MQVNPYLSFKGNCREAFTFYEKVIGGKVTMMATYGETPAADHVPAEMRDDVIHARMEIGNTLLMGGDPPPDMYADAHGMSVSLMVNNAAEAERIFTALSDGGSVMMPFEETFFAKRFGMCRDKFGIPWMVSVPPV